MAGSPGVPERWIERVLAERDGGLFEPGRCSFGHVEPGEEFCRGFDYEYHTLRDEFRGVVCPRCGAWYLDPRPAEKLFPLIYPETYSAYEMSDESGTGRGLAFRAKSWLERRKIRRYARFVRALDGDVLDVGCADGLLLDGFAQEGFPRQGLVGVDFHPTAIRLTCSKGYQAVEGRFEDVELEPSRYRLVVMNQLIEHMVDPLEALRKLQTILAPGGYAFLETPNIRSPNARLARRRYWGGYHYPRHLHLFSAETMTRMVEQAGLQVVEIRFVPCPVQWIVTINSCLQEWKRPPQWLLRFTDWRNPLLLGIFTALDLVLMPLGTANMQVVCRRPVEPV